MSDPMMIESDADYEFELARQAEVQAAIAAAVAAIPQDDYGDELADVQHDPTLVLEGNPIEGVEVEGDEEPEPVVEKAPDKTPEARGMLRLQEKETELRKAREALETERAGWEAKLRDLEAKVKSASETPKGLDPTKVKRALMGNPMKFFEEHNVDPDSVARFIIATRLGDKAPPQALLELERARTRAEIEDVREELERDRAALAKERARNGAKDRASKVKGDSKYPTLAKLAEADQAWVEDVIWRSTEGDNFDATLERLEKEYSVFAKAFGSSPVTQKSEPAASKQVDTQPAKTEREGAKAQTKKARTPAPPRPYWEPESDESAERDAAFAEALRQLRAANRK